MISLKPILFGVTIQENSCYGGGLLKKIQLPNNSILLGLLRQGEFVLAAEEPTIYCEDYILALAFHPAIVPTLKVILKKTHPVSWSFLRSGLTSKNWAFPVK